MRYTKENISEIIKDLSLITTFLSEGGDPSCLVINKHTDVLLEVMIEKHKRLFLEILKKGFPNNKNKYFLYTHKAVATNDIFFVKQLFEHYKKNNIKLEEVDMVGNNALHIALGIDGMSKEIIDFLIKEGISLEHKNEDGLSPKDILEA